MKTLGALVGAAVLAAVSIGGVASAQNLQEDKAWQFRTPDQKVVLQNDLVLMQQKQNDYYKAYKNGAAGAFGAGAGGLLGSATSATNNQTYIFNQTTNNCTNTGGTLSCGSGNVSGTVSQTTTDSTNSATSTITGNTVTNTPTTTTNSGNSGSTTITGH